MTPQSRSGLTIVIIVCCLDIVWEPIRETTSHATRHGTLVLCCLSPLSLCGQVLGLKKCGAGALRDNLRLNNNYNNYININNKNNNNNINNNNININNNNINISNKNNNNTTNNINNGNKCKAQLGSDSLNLPP